MQLRQILDDPRRRIWLVVFPALLALTAIFSAVTANAIEAAAQRESAERWYVHTLQILLVTGRLETSVNAALRGERGYLLTNDAQFLSPYLRGRGEAQRLAGELDRLTRDNPKQQRNLGILHGRLRDYLLLLEQTVAVAKAGQTSRAIEVVRAGAGKRRIEAVLAVLDEVKAEERRLLADRREASAQAKQRIERSARALALAGLLLLLLLAYACVAALNANLRAAKATAELRRLATTDELTGLANRAHFMDGLERECARSLRTGSPLCIAILDLDHFKKINDLHGHPAGDEVLRIVARVLRTGTRGHDLVGRIGGEEFAILMPETDRDQAALVCERLCKAMELTPVQLPNEERRTVTFSTGVAALSEGETVSHLISRADTALYQAKFGGRNQVKLAA